MIDYVILARGGSKGIKSKNIAMFCGKPLISWTIEQCLELTSPSFIWVSTDDKKIIEVSKKYKVNIIRRPAAYSRDTSTSEIAWEHAIKHLRKVNHDNKIIVSPQVTSPIRESLDIKKALIQFKKQKLDSLFSASVTNDILIWRKKRKRINSENYNFKKRLRRQDFYEQIIENGSFYIFKSDKMIDTKNRLFGKIGYFKMSFWKMFEIDNPEDFKLCEIIMKNYLIKDKKL